MADKLAAFGSIIKADIAVANTFVAVPLVISATPPPRERIEIDAGGLDDVIDVPLLGIEGRSKYTFTHFWEPDDTEHEKFDTAFAANDEFSIQIVYPTTPAVTDEFDCRITKITPEELTRDGTIRRQIEVVRTSAITRT